MGSVTGRSAPSAHQRRLVAAIASAAMIAFLAIAWATGGDFGTAQARIQVRIRAAPLVAHGHSPHHVPWRIRAKRDHVADAIDIDFFLDRSGEDGYGTQIPFPVPHSFIFTADTGSDLDRYHERDLSGVTTRRVTKLLLTMSKGDRIKLRPHLAPRRVRRHHGWLDGLRFFDRFYLGHRRPRWVTALNAEGHVLAHRHTDRGFF
jgi:hypothetical protein